MPEQPTDAHFLFTFVFKQALRYRSIFENRNRDSSIGTRGSGLRMIVFRSAVAVSAAVFIILSSLSHFHRTRKTEKARR